MGDHNGRIGEIVSAFQKYPAGDRNTRIIVRKVLRAEREDGQKEGYSDALEDTYEDRRVKADAEHDGCDVHIDWHCTKEEWAELRHALLDSTREVPYIQRLVAAGKLEAVPGE